MGVPHFSTGNREQVPSEQSQFWTAHALITIPLLPGGHLDSVAQEVVTPPDIMSMIGVWLSDTVTIPPGGIFTGSPCSDSLACETWCWTGGKPSPLADLLEQDPR